MNDWCYRYIRSSTRKSGRIYKGKSQYAADFGNQERVTWLVQKCGMKKLIKQCYIKRLFAYMNSRLKVCLSNGLNK